MAKMKNYAASGRWICHGGQYDKLLDGLYFKASSKKNAVARAKREFNKQRPSKKLGVGKSCRLKMGVVEY